METSINIQQNTTGTSENVTQTQPQTQTQDPKVVFANNDGRVCLAPSLSWFCREYHIGKGVVSDMNKKKKISHRDWYLVDKHWLPAVYRLLNKPPDWYPGVVGTYKCDPVQVSLLIQKLIEQYTQEKAISL